MMRPICVIIGPTVALAGFKVFAVKDFGGHVVGRGPSQSPADKVEISSGST
jgi:hypothetical protein